MDKIHLECRIPNHNEFNHMIKYSKYITYPMVDFSIIPEEHIGDLIGHVDK